MNGMLMMIFISAMVASLLNTNEVECHEIIYYQNVNESVAANAFQEEKTVPNSSKKLVCFYVFTNSFSPSIMDGLCTHINVGFFRISETNYSLEVSNEQEHMLSQIMLLKKNASDLKIIISVGGAGDTGFSDMTTNHTTRKIFIKSCMEFIKKFKADGLDLDWEWPVVSSGNLKEKVRFVQLLHEIKNEFDRHEKKYILSVDVSAAKVIIELGYYVNYIADFIDYVNVMCYDYHFFTKYYPFTGHNAPLYSSKVNIFSSDINQTISFWIKNSMPREKIVLGIPTYGHTFQLTFSNQHALVAPARGFGSVGMRGFASFQEICEFLKLQDTMVVYDNVSKVPYAYRYPEWISYDDEGSLATKANYILEQNLSGAMVFSVNADDYNGTCKGNGVLLPLIRRVRSILLNEL